MSKFESGEFTNQWFDGNIPTFKKHLFNYIGKDVNVLEIGSWEGRSTCWLMENILTSEKSRLTCIDTWQGGEEHKVMPIEMKDVETRFLGNTEPFHSRMEIIKANSKDGLISIRDRVEYYDFIYIDGGHTMYDVLTDCVLSFDLLKSGGIMAFDDYKWCLNQFHPSKTPYAAVNALVTSLHGKIETIHNDFQYWIIKK